MYLPKHSSWLNQIEVIFGIVMRKVMRRGNFTSVADLETKLRAFLTYFNQTLAHPFDWTYTGKPVALATGENSARRTDAGNASYKSQAC